MHLGDLSEAFLMLQPNASNRTISEDWCRLNVVFVTNHTIITTCDSTRRWSD